VSVNRFRAGPTKLVTVGARVADANGSPTTIRPLLALWRAPAAADRSGATSAADRNVERLLMLLGDSDMTIALRERGIRAPAQCLYDLQLAGYPIERVQLKHDCGRGSVQYRLSPR